MKFLILSVLTILINAGQAQAQSVGLHGMVVFGNKVTYASHLPMFHHPHDRQLIMKISMSTARGSSALIEYEKAKEAGKTLFTIAPEVMDLDLVASGTQKVFSADLFDGHFERGGKNLGKVTVQVEKNIFNSKLNPAPLPQNSIKYFVFGSGGAESEYFMFHIITGKPSFDVIASVEPEVIPDEGLPLVLSGPKDLEGLESIGDVLNGITVKIKKIIYLEKEELSH